jgi:predicted AAA+ superfamily ATPase
MQSYIPRFITDKVEDRLRAMAAVAILGPRQCGKTTLAAALLSGRADALHLDLERAADRNKLQDPEAFFELNAGKLICLDEIQRLPEIFAEMRAFIDRKGKNGRFLILGSASPELIRQSSETLAGRIAFLELTPFLLPEIAGPASSDRMRVLWLRGGFPRSYLAEGEADSYEWRQDFIRTFLERDIPALGAGIPARRIERFWQMCAHVHGQLLNRSKLGESLGVSHHTIDSYLGLLEQTYLLRVLQSFHPNVKKRLVKSPKIFIRDTGLLHALLGIRSQNDLLGHPVYGPSWEGFVIENVTAVHRQWRPYFYRSASGAEIDLVLEKGQKRVAVEAKASTSPEVKRSFFNALEDAKIDEAWIVAPVDESYPYRKGVTVAPLETVIRQIGQH